MKTKNFFLAVCLLAFSALNAQNNVVVTTTQATPGQENTIIGNSAGFSTNTNFNNTFIGNYSGYNTLYDSSLSDSGSFNSFIGTSSGFANTTGRSNTFVGFSTGINNVTGQTNTLLGSYANNRNGSGNTFLGHFSGSSTNDGSHNIGIGTSAGRKLVTGNFNVLLGYEAGYGITNGINNVCIGLGAGGYPSTNVGRDNILIGRLAGYSLDNSNSNNSNYNIFIGEQCGESVYGSRNVFLGSVRFIPGTTSTTTIAGSDINSSIILADGGQNQRVFIDEIGYTGIGLGNYNKPQNRLEIAAGATSAGLRFKNLTSGSTSITNPTNKVLSVNDSGDVILVDDKQGTGSGTATTNILVSNTNTMTSTVNSIVANAPIVNTVVNSITSGQLTTTVNGVSSTPITLPTSGSGSDTSIYINDGSIIPANTGNRVVTLNDNNLVFNTSGSNNARNKVYIGSDFLTGTPFPTTTGDYRLYVEGGVLTEKVKVALRSTANWADYVFANDYKLMPLNEVETFVKSNKHLPGISSADKLVNEGLDLGEMQAKQMEKIEELTLYAIEQNKKIEKQEKEIEKQEKEIEELKVLVKALMEKK